MIKHFFTLLCFLVIGTLTLNAQVHINEYSASNLENFLDNYGRTEDWIELYNSSDSDVDISGWYLSDKEDKPTKWTIPAGTIIPANGFLVFWCSGRDVAANNNYHTNFKLTQTKGSDMVSLANASGDVIDLLPLDLTLVEHSRCRQTDGSEEWRVCTEPSLGTSNNDTPQFRAYTQTPTMSLEAGFYEGTQTVSISNNEPNSIIRYTTDGSNPTENSDIYNSALTINSTQVIKAQVYSNDPMILTGKMDFNTYFINEDDFSLVVFSVASDDVIDLANGDGELIPIGSLEYFNLDKEREATSFGSLNRHGQDSWVLPHRSLDWVSRDEMGYSKAVEAELFSFSDRNEYQKFMFRNSGDDNYPAINDNDHEGSTHIRDEYVQTLAQEGGMKLDNRAVERVILFLNGEYWGVYGMRDRPVDHDYTDEYYNQGKYDLQYLTTWGTTELQYGGIQAQRDWENLRDFILENDMSVPENYQIADDSINLLSLMDYMIVNLNVVASDWLNYNTGWWRGRNPDGDHKKWGYILWDLDATFDYYINYSGVPNISPDAEPCDLEDIADYMDDFFSSGGFNPANCNSILNGTCPYPSDDPIFRQVVAEAPFCCFSDWDEDCQSTYDQFVAQGGGNTAISDGDVGQHEKIFLKLLDENAEFKQLYYSRQADMMNTVFSCENMMETLDRMLAVIEPEMPRQIDRWGGTMAEWRQNVNRLKNFIEERCTLLDDGMTGCYEELTGPYPITLLAEPDGVGEIDFNTLDIENFPWNGEYFGGMENNIKAKVFNDFEDDYEFSHWVSTSGNVIFPDVNERKASITLTQSDTLIAVFSSISSNYDLDDNVFEVAVFPNPTQDHLTLEYTLDKTMETEISLHNTMGQHLTTFVAESGRRTAGKHRIALDLTTKNMMPGIYFLRLRLGDDEVIRKVTVI